MWNLLTAPTRLTPKPRRRTPLRPRLESLEGRVVLSVAFDSVLGVGSDTASFGAWDNAVDSAGNSYVTGILYGTTDLDPAVDRPDGSDILTPRGNTDAFLAKYAPDNTLLWARQMGGDLDTSSLYSYDWGRSVKLDVAGNVYVSGGFHGQADFGPYRLTSAGDSDAFVAKLDSSGNFLWANRWGGTARESARDLAIDSAGNAVSVGATNLVPPSGSGSIIPNGSEVHRFGATGAASRAVRYDTARANGVTTDAAGNVYVVGSFQGTVDFDPNPRRATYLSGASGASNGFVQKLTSAGAFA
ncbi:hypothetical protein [Paludisphaera soli]|uniref:hypothetical protein n=1 Tax=Paludisphaera soli TaxID=2712865 RepID=UPI0013EBD822|nr:hypothetical protein [Paludisphaera soli]